LCRQSAASCSSLAVRPSDFHKWVFGLAGFLWFYPSRLSLPGSAPARRPAARLVVRYDLQTGDRHGGY
jgi:hypothetical protein